MFGNRKPDFSLQSTFTLIEMLVVITIIAILAALLMPSLQKAVESGKATACGNNLKQTGLSLNMYCDDNGGWIPSSWAWWRNEVPATWYGKPLFQTYGLGSYTDVLIFSACPSIEVAGTKYYGINEVLGSGGFGRTVWPPKAPSTRLAQISHPSMTLTFTDGADTGDTWMARPLLVPMGGTFATIRKWGWQRHQEMPLMVHADGHSSRKPYVDMDIYTWSDESTAYWKK